MILNSAIFAVKLAPRNNFFRQVDILSFEEEGKEREKWSYVDDLLIDEVKQLISESEERPPTRHRAKKVKEEQFPFKEEGKRNLFEILEWTESLVFAITVAILLLVFIFKNVGIEGSSMENTLHNGDRVLISNLFYKPEQFDVVVINKPNFEHKPFIKRIIAVEGQTIDIDFESGIVLIDGEYIDEPYIRENIRNHVYHEISFPVEVPSGCIFVMGDNRNNSTDSRSELLGMVDKRYIMGKVLLKLYPFNEVKLIK